MALALEKARALYEEGLVDSYLEGIEQGIEKGIEQGVEKGREKDKIGTALNMLKVGISVELVSECTKLAVEEIEKLIQKI